MSSLLKLNRICNFCGKEFIAQKTTTKTCSANCAKKAYKAKMRGELFEETKKEVQQIKNKPIEDLKAKEFLTVRDVAKLLSCSRITVYRLIESKELFAVNLLERKTLVSRAEIDKFFLPPQNIVPIQKIKPKTFIESEYYTINEIQQKYSISDVGLNNIIKRNKIEKIQKGWFVYVLKIEIDKIFNQNKN